MVTMEETGMPFPMADWVKADFDYLAKRVQNPDMHRDAVLIYTGEEGSGKTSLASQHAYYLADSMEMPFGIDNYYFTPDQLYEAVMPGKHPPGTIFLYDEAITGLMAKQALKREHVRLQIMFSTCRSKRYVLFVLIPRFRELPDWMAIDRSMALYKTYTKPTKDDPAKPGFYVGYNKKNKQWLYIWEKSRRYDMVRKVKHTFETAFNAWPFGPKSVDVPFSYEEYEGYKRDSLAYSDQVERNPLSDVWMLKTLKLAQYLQDMDLMTEQEISERIDVPKYQIKKLYQIWGLTPE